VTQRTVSALSRSARMDAGLPQAAQTALSRFGMLERAPLFTLSAVIKAT
jgi:hypothetical protein